MLILEKPWTRQPQTVVKAKPAGFRHLIYGDKFSGVDGGVWTPTNAPPIAATPVGLARQFTAASAQAITTPAQNLSQTNITLFGLVRRTTNAINATIINVGAASGNNRTLLYFASDSLAIFSGAGAITGQATTGVSSYTNTTDYVAVVGRVFSSTSRSVWAKTANSALLTGINTSNSSPSTPATVSVGGYWNDGSFVAGFYMAGFIAVAGVIPYAINDSQAMGLLNDLNGWVRWLEPRRILIPTAAAAATAPTITALSARLITDTSAQPRISYS